MAVPGLVVTPPLHVGQNSKTTGLFLSGVQLHSFCAPEYANGQRLFKRLNFSPVVCLVQILCGTYHKIMGQIFGDFCEYTGFLARNNVQMNNCFVAGDLIGYAYQRCAQP